MDEAWERAVEAALDGQAAESSSSSSSPRTLNLDGAVKCLHGRLPPPSLFEKFQNLEHLSVASVGASSLEKFPRLRNLQRLILSDNRIAGGLEFLVEAGLDSLRDLDLSNNRIQFLEDLAPLAQLRLVSLDLYECPVTRVKDYRCRVFGMIRSLKYLDKMDADENERPESDDEEDDDEEEEEDEIDGDDPGSGEIDGEDRAKKAVNGVGGNGDEVGVVDVDVDVDEDESDADEEETETGGRREANGSHQHHSNGFRVATVGQEVDEDGDEEDVDDEEDEEEDGGDNEMGEEIDADDGEDEDVVVVHDVVDSDEDEDGVHEEEDDEDDDEVDDDDDVDEDEVEDEEVEGEPGSTGRLMSAEGEIDGHEQGEEDENGTGELGEADEEGVEEDRDPEDDDGDEEEDADGEYLVQPIPQPERAARGCGDSDACDEDEEEEVDDEDTRPSNGSIPSEPYSSSQHSKSKRKRDDNGDLVDDSVEDLRSSKH